MPRLLSVSFQCLLVLGITRADEVVVHGESERTAHRFQEIVVRELAARKAPGEERWGEVLDEYQSLLASAGNDLIPVPGQSNLRVRARWLCHARLAALPADGLRLYRGRVDGRASRWLELGKRFRDQRLLRRVVEDAFCSRAGGAALELLGDLAFEQGDFGAAGFWWRRLAPAPDEHPGSSERFLPRYPNAGTAAARAQAKQLLARWFESGSANPAAWKRALAAFRKRHPQATGYLAGGRGLYWKRLQAVAERNPTPGSALTVEDDGWPTFGGSATRNRVLPARAVSPFTLSRLCRYGRHWRFPLGSAIPPPPGTFARPSDFGRSLAFQPVIVGRYVLMADARYVTAFDTTTGKRQHWCDVTRFNGGFPSRKLPAPPDRRYTLTVAGDCVLARQSAGILVCLNLRPDGRGNRLRWRATPGARTAFEGTAICAANRAYIAATRMQNGRATTAIHCYPLESRDLARPRWKKAICTTDALSADAVRQRHCLLTLAGSNVVYCSHSGVIVALDAATGQRVWAVRYRQGRASGDDRPLSPRGLNPCICVGGKLYVAPDDTDQLLCLDAATGYPLWKRERIEAVHLLGVGQGRLIFTTTTPRPGLRAVDARNGGDRGGWFRTVPGGSAPLILFGRGFLAGDRVYWPTFHRVHALDQRDGAAREAPSLLHRVPRGNLVFGKGILAVADNTTLHVFAPWSRAGTAKSETRGKGRLLYHGRLTR